MSDLLPTQEQEAASDAICTWMDVDGDSYRAALVEDIALLLVARDEMHAAVIRRLRAILAEVVRDDCCTGCISGTTLNQANEALFETEQYEVNE